MKRSVRNLLKWTWLLVIVSGVFIAESAVAYNTKFGYKSAILLDYDTGMIIYQEDAHAPAIPASLVKMMVLYLTMEQLEAGRIHLSDRVTVSAWASRMGGQQVYLQKGEIVTLEDLLKAMVITSANDAATAVAEYIAGSADACVAQMNVRAQTLGMRDTMFANVHGLPPSRGQKDNVTSAYDMAILGRALMKRFPQVLEWTSTLKDTFRNGAFTLTNTNRRFLRSYPGADGLKTGFHAKAGFNVCATAKRENHRLIAVILDVPTKRTRDRVARELLDMGFAHYGLISQRMK